MEAIVAEIENEEQKTRIIRSLHLQLQALFLAESGANEAVAAFLERPNDFGIQVTFIDKKNEVPNIGTSWSIND